MVALLRHFLPAILTVLIAEIAFAQVTGKVVGSVTDSDTGQPLVGAQVVVEGTNLGNVTNEDGSYFINNVPVGLEQLTAQYLGYQTTTNEQRILAGQTMALGFQLSSEVVQAEGIVALIDREPLVVRDNMISKSRFTGEEARSLPTSSMDEVIELGAGIYQDRANCGITFFDDTGCGFIIRGGRATESATYVDGALVTDFNDQTDMTRVTREGGREYHGNVRFTTDELSDAIEQSYGFNNLQASLGGPIISDKLTAYGSFEATGAEDFFSAVAGFNPATGNQLDDSGSTE